MKSIEVLGLVIDETGQDGHAKIINNQLMIKRWCGAPYLNAGTVESANEAQATIDQYLSKRVLPMERLIYLDQLKPYRNQGIAILGHMGLNEGTGICAFITSIEDDLICTHLSISDNGVHGYYSIWQELLNKSTLFFRPLTDDEMRYIKWSYDSQFVNGVGRLK